MMSSGLQTQVVKKYSVISILSFIMCLGALGLEIFSITNVALRLINNPIINIISGITLILFIIVSVVLAIIDICLKNRKKTLSIIALVVSGGFLGLFTIILFVLTLYTSSGPT